MKELSFEKMEEVNGGLNCFFSLSYLALGYLSLGGGWAIYADAVAFRAYCFLT